MEPCYACDVAVQILQYVKYYCMEVVVQYYSKAE